MPTELHPSSDALHALAKRIRYDILTATTLAGSGHPTSALSATDLMTGLLFGGNFRYETNFPENPNNDRLVFSKGHASPLLYALWASAGQLTEQELETYRNFDSPLEGHPSMAFPFTEVATGSLGQGLAVGLGFALHAKYVDKLPYRTYVLLGDSEMAEGSQWESIELAAHYRLGNLVGILDVNRLGQRGETMYGHDLDAYRRRFEAFGWKTLLIDGHHFPDILAAYDEVAVNDTAPSIIIARTIKGKGISFLEDQEGWHGKALDQDQYQRALEELGGLDKMVQATVATPEVVTPKHRPAEVIAEPNYNMGEPLATRDAFGNALCRIYPHYPKLVSLDAEVGNSTRAAHFAKEHPKRFFEMYIAEQNMVGAALGLALRGDIPFVSTFAAFFTRAFDQIRMSQYSDANIKFVGSHAGVSIGQDGPSQMGLEDIAMFRTLLNSVVLYPSDATSADRLVEAAAERDGLVYLRMTRNETPVLYDAEEEFPIGGSKILRQSEDDTVTVIGAGITLHEALAAYDALASSNIRIRVIDLYSIKPIDRETLRTAARETSALLTVEDHYEAGGLGEAVRSALFDVPTPVHSLAVRKKPKSGQARELLDFEDISSRAIIDKVKSLLP